MTTAPLSNSSWGFESNCFVCEPANAAGLRIPFFHDDERGIVFADFELGDEFSGAPSYVHGGIVMAIVDEAMAWAAIAIERCWALTETTTVSFARPTRLGRPHRVEARVTAITECRDKLDAEAVVTDYTGRVCATASARFHAIDAGQASDAIGADVSPDNSSYVREV